MRPCSIKRPNGDKIPAFLVRCGPKNSRVSFNGDRNCTELVPSDLVFEIVEATTKPATSGPSYVNLCTEAAAIGQKMEQALTGAGVLAAPHMNLQERLDGLRALRDGKCVVVEGELWSREEAEAAGAIELSGEEEDDDEEDQASAA